MTSELQSPSPEAQVPLAGLFAFGAPELTQFQQVPRGFEGYRKPLDNASNWASISISTSIYIGADPFSVGNGMPMFCRSLLMGEWFERESKVKKLTLMETEKMTLPLFDN